MYRCRYFRAPDLQGVLRRWMKNTCSSTATDASPKLRSTTQTTSGATSDICMYIVNNDLFQFINGLPSSTFAFLINRFSCQELIYVFFNDHIISTKSDPKIMKGFFKKPFRRRYCPHIIKSTQVFTVNYSKIVLWILACSVLFWNYLVRCVKMSRKYSVLSKIV